jgi:HEAT repeat protein
MSIKLGHGHRGAREQGFITEDSPAERALQVLTKLGTRAGPAIPKIRTLLREMGDSNLPAFAATALKNIGPEARSAILDLIRLLSAQSEYNRAAAADALGEIGGESLIPTLVVMVEEESQDWVAEVGELALNRLRARLKPGRR